MAKFLFDVLDALFLTIAKAFVPLEPIKKNLDNISGFSDDQFQYFRDAIDTVQNRASILLAHISIVLAVVALFISSYENVTPMLILFSVVVASFLVLTIVLLRIVGSVTDQNEKIETRDEYIKLIKDESAVRYCLFRFSVFVTIVITVFLVLGFIVYPPVAI